MEWGVTVVAFAAIAAILVLYSLLLLARRLEFALDPGRTLAIGAGLSLLAGGAVALVTWSGTSPGVLQAVLDECFRKRDSLGSVVRVTCVMSGVSIGGGLLMSLAAAACVLDVAAKEDHAAATRAASDELNCLLLLSAALLVTGILETQALYSWPLAYLPESLGRILSETAGAATSSIGTLYSILLAIVFGVAHWSLREMGGASIRASQPDPSAQRVLIKSAGLEVSLGSTLLRVLTALAPLVAGGPLPALLKLLSTQGH
jgi:hypothetical protein